MITGNPNDSSANDFLAIVVPYSNAPKLILLHFFFLYTLMSLYFHNRLAIRTVLYHKRAYIDGTTEYLR